MISGFFFRLLLTLPPALLCGLQGNDLFVPLSTLLLLIPFLLTKKRLTATVLHCALLILPAASLAFLPMLFNGATFSVNYLDMRFFLPMCCFCAVIFLYLDNVTPACVTEIIVFLLLARPGAATPLLLESLPADTIFTAVIFCSAAAAILLFSERTPGEKRAQQLRFLLLLLPLPLLMFVINHLYQKNYDLIRSWNLRGRFYALHHHRPDYTNRNESDLNLPLRRDPEFEKRILFYAESEDAPAYLKSNTFERYRRGVWNKPYAVGEELTGDMKDHTTIVSLSAEPALAADRRAMTVYPQEHGLFTHVPLPENCYSVELVAEKIVQMPWGDLTPYQWNKDAAYTAHYSIGTKPGMRESVPPSEKCLYVPRSLKFPLTKLLGDRILTGPEIRNDRDLVMRVADYLKNNYHYSLNATHPERYRYNRYHDPVFRFLFATREGHCELFAAACTMLLRSAGLHARYVTGFLCRRKLKGVQNIWFATGLDAHAWTEVYLPDERRWIRIDATPGSDNMEIVETEPALRDHFSLLKNRIAAYIRNGRFLSIWDEIGEHPWQYILLLPLPVLIIFAMILFIRKKRKNGYAPKLSRTKRQAAKKFTRLAKKVMRRTRIKRKRNETFREWMARLDEADRDALLPALHEYEKQRFSD